MRTIFCAITLVYKGIGKHRWDYYEPGPLELVKNKKFHPEAARRRIGTTFYGSTHSAHLHVGDERLSDPNPNF